MLVIGSLGIPLFRQKSATRCDKNIIDPLFSPHVLMCDAHQDVEESLAIEPDGSPSSPSASPLREAMCLVPMGISTNIVVLLGKT